MERAQLTTGQSAGRGQAALIASPSLARIHTPDLG
jgi:hypothetical protein